MARMKAAAAWLMFAAAALGGIAFVKRQLDDFRGAAAPFERLTGRRIEAAGDGVGELSGRRGLQSLDLNGSALTDAELLDLKTDLEALPGLDRLMLARTLVRGPGLAALQNLQGLHSLDLRQSPVSDEGLEGLRPLSGLRRLGLAGTRITDAGMRHLEALDNLHVLWLGRTQISDACIPQLSRLKQLDVLSLEQTRVSEAGVQRLEEALPDCVIIR
jgi:hypothetical protein